MKKTFLVLVVLFLLLTVFWLCSDLLSNVLAKNVQPPQRSITTNGKVSSLFTVNNTDQTTVLAYSIAAGLPTFYSINWKSAANIAGMLEQSTINGAFSPSAGTINGIIVPSVTLSGFYEGLISIAGYSITSNYTIRFSLMPMPTVGYKTKLFKNLISTSERLMPAINNLFTLAVA
jgi:Na+-transporting methylmalonyl-CoA/oxaloacetate decarboxylase gamma subunit